MASRRRVQGDDADGHAVGGGAVPSRVGAVGRRRQHSDKRTAAGGGAASDEGPGLAPNDIASLQKMEWPALMAAGNAAVAKVNPRTGPAGDLLGAGARGLVAERGRQDHQRAVVLRCGAGDFEECADDDRFGERRGQPDASRPTEEQWHAGLARAYGDEKATAIIAAMKKSYPEKAFRRCPICAAARSG